MGMPACPAEPRLSRQGGRRKLSLAILAETPHMSDVPSLIDTHGRAVRDLRISVTERCNLRCVYCMPAEGMPWLPKDDLLTYEEIARFAGVCLTLGVTGIRLTGGEPTVRADLPVLVRMLSALRPGLDLSLTTNGLKLVAMAGELRAAGLTRVNVSLDTLDRERFHAIARRDRLADVLAGLEAARRVGFQPIKVNAVLMRGFNEDEAVRGAAERRERRSDRGPAARGGVAQGAGPSHQQPVLPSAAARDERDRRLTIEAVAEDRFAAKLRGFGPIGLAAFVLIVLGNTLFLPLSALLVLLWARRSRTPLAALGFVRPRSWTVTILLGVAFGVAFKLVMKSVVMPL